MIGFNIVLGFWLVVSPLGDAFTVGLFTVIVDELLQHAILDRHVHSVVSLMAGLDAPVPFALAE